MWAGEVDLCVLCVPEKIYSVLKKALDIDVRTAKKSPNYSPHFSPRYKISVMLRKGKKSDRQVDVGMPQYSLSSTYCLFPLRDLNLLDCI